MEVLIGMGVLNGIGALVNKTRRGVLNGIGALINKTRRGGVLIRKGASIGRSTLTRIIMVVA